MINIFYGRENLNKEEFIYKQIFNRNRKCIVIVPDQYGLEAEKTALKYARLYSHNQSTKQVSQDIQSPRMRDLNSSPISLVNVEIKTFSRLMHDVFSEVGGLNTVYVDRVGREIILSKVLREIDYTEMKAFANQIRKPGFAKVCGDFISQVKLENLTPKDIFEMADLSKDEPELYCKLWDLGLIFEAYEEALAGTFSDNEDRYTGFINKIDSSKTIASTDFWFYGFDSFTGKAYRIIEALANMMKRSGDGSSLNFVISYDGANREDLFKAGAAIIAKIKSMEGIDANSDVRISQIGDEYRVSKPQDLVHLEDNLYKLNPEHFEGRRKNIRIVKTQNAYFEAEACAVHIRELLRERNFRMRDIAILCNDGDSRISILKRILKDYDIDLFVDSRQPISKEPFVRYLISGLEAVRKKYSTYYVINFIKNPFSSLSAESLAVEKLENYARMHKIKGSMWKKPFIYIEPLSGRNIADDDAQVQERQERLTEINRLRESATSPLIRLENIVKLSERNGETIKEFAEKYFEYMREIALSNKIENDVMWKSLISILDQIVELIGDEKFGIDVFSEAFYTGLEAVTVGNTPPSVDDLLVGSTQRTRTGQIKALIVLGMNEGLIPKQIEQDSLITRYEISLVDKQNSDNSKYNSPFYGLIAKTENLDMEERLAIYRNFSKPTEDIWISFVSNNLRGEEQLPSELIDDFEQMFGEKKNGESELKSIIELASVSKNEYIVESPMGTLSNLARFYSLNDSSSITPELSAAEAWFENIKMESDKSHDSISRGMMNLGTLGMLKRIRDYEYIDKPLDSELTAMLYSRERHISKDCSPKNQDVFSYEKDRDVTLRLSPSRLEQFSRCPYKYFVNFGLKPASNEPIEYKSTDIGVFMHDVMEKFCLWADDGNKWVELETADIREKVDMLVDDFSEKNLSVLFPQTGKERYITERVQSIVKRAAEKITDFRRDVKISSSEYEKSFEYKIHGSGDKLVATIQGFVDRIDYMDVDDEKIFTIIDYKTGGNSFKGKYIESGYDLQLFIYVAAIEAESDKKNSDSNNLKGMGAFYINLNDENRNNSKGEFLMSGAVAEEIGEIIGKNYAKLISRARDKTYPAESMSKEDFEKYKTDVVHKVKELCGSIMAGDVAIRPLRIDADADACKYCEFGDICRYSSYYNKVVVG